MVKYIIVCPKNGKTVQANGNQVRYCSTVTSPSWQYRWSVRKRYGNQGVGKINNTLTRLTISLVFSIL